MNRLLVVGSLAFDTVETPYGKREFVLGGSANYFSLSASFFTDVSMVAVVGEDFPQDHLQFLKKRGVDIKGIQQVEGKTFHWKGSYSGDMNEAQTLETHLNVFENFSPTLPNEYKDSEMVFLANIDPDLQLKVLEQVNKPKLVACDTMNFWIHGKRNALLNVLKKVDLFLSNEQEVKDLSGQKNLLSAVSWIQEKGPKAVIVKRGEYGAMLFHENSMFWTPAYPLEVVKDPTGAGDTFAGGLMGIMAQGDNFSNSNLRCATVIGSLMASFNVEEFSFDGLQRLTNEALQTRYHQLRNISMFEAADLPLKER